MSGWSIFALCCLAYFLGVGVTSENAEEGKSSGFILLFIAFIIFVIRITILFNTGG